MLSGFSLRFWNGESRDSSLLKMVSPTKFWWVPIQKSKDWRSWETLQCAPDDCCASGSKVKKILSKQFSNKGHGWNYCFECNKKQHYYWIMLENIVSVSCRSQIAFDRWPCKWIRIIFSSVNMCTKLEKDTLYGRMVFTKLFLHVPTSENQ